jgi:capsular polysaccharide biosynthesis protein/Mrp family chromosome partitioning ATPase
VRGNIGLISLVTLVVLSGAIGFTLWWPAQYKSTARVLVSSAVAAGGGSQQADMATEKQVVSSDAVLSKAATNLAVPLAQLRRGLAVDVPVDTRVLVVGYSAADAPEAQRRAAAIAQSYVDYRTQSSGVPGPPREGGGVTNGTAVQRAADVITPASLPESPARPNLAVIVLEALIVGAGLGTAAALIRDRLDDRIRGTADVERRTGLPVLATVPNQHRREFPRQRRPGPAGASLEPSPEAYRLLRTRITRLAGESGAKIVQVTSAERADLASMVAANLAVTAALARSRVVLVGTAFAGSRFHEMFGLERADGFLDAVAGDRPAVDLLHSTTVPGLRVMAPGRDVDDASAFFALDAARAVLDDIAERADLVVVDSSPLLAGADALTLAGQADHVLLVEDAERSTRRQVDNAVAVLRDAGDVAAGVVLVSGDAGGSAGVGGRAGGARLVPAPQAQAPPTGGPVPDGRRDAQPEASRGSRQ